MAPALASRMDAAGDFQQELEDTAGTAPRQNKLSLINLQLMAMIGNASKPGTLCQVDNCDVDVSELKEYYLRFKICDDHLRAKSAIKDGIQQRFCQQCGKFHPVEDFDGDKRSCRERLDKHNARRRRMREMQNMLRTTGTLDMAALEAKYGPLEDDEPKPKKPPASKSKGKSKAPTRARPAPEESLRLASAKELHAVNFPDIPSLSPADFDILGDEFLDGELEAILKLPDFPTTASGASTDARSGSSANLSPGVASMQQISSEVAINTDAAAAAAAMAECAEALAHAVPMTGMESPTPGMSAFVLPSEAEAMAALQEQEQQQQNHHPHQQQQQPCHVYVQQQVPQQQVQQLPAAAFPVNNFVVAAQTPGNGPFTATPVRIVRQFSATSSNGTLSDKGVVVTGANDVQQVVYIQDPNVPHAAGHRSNESTAFTQAGMLSSDQFVVMHQERRDPTAFDQSQMVQAAHGKRMRCSSKLFDSMQSDLAPRGFLGGSQLETIEEVEQVVVHAFNTGEYPSDEWFSKQYLAYPIDVLMKIEERFLSLLDATVAKWKSDESARPGIEQRLASLFSLRRFISQLLLEERPDVHRMMACNSGPSEPGAADWFESLVDTLDITEEQRQAMMPSWRQYRELIESLQQQAAEMRQVVSGSPTPTTDNGAPLTVKAPSKFVSPMEAKAWIKAYPRRVTSAYGFLIIGIASQLRPMQHAMLVLGCQPYAPDFVRLCTVLLDGRSPGGRTLPCLELH